MEQTEVINHNRVGKSSLKEKFSVFIGGQNLILLSRSEKVFLRKHHFNRNLKTAVGVSQTEWEEELLDRGDQHLCPSGGTVCARSGSSEQG